MTNNNNRNIRQLSEKMEQEQTPTYSNEMATPLTAFLREILVMHHDVDDGDNSVISSCVSEDISIQSDNARVSSRSPVRDHRRSRMDLMRESRWEGSSSSSTSPRRDRDSLPSCALSCRRNQVSVSEATRATSRDFPPIKSVRRADDQFLRTASQILEAALEIVRTN
jgi:hypothetical protein